MPHNSEDIANIKYCNFQVSGVCISCKEEKVLHCVDIFECRVLHRLCDNCINSTDVYHCPVHRLSLRRC